MKQVLIFCESYVIVENVLYLLKENKGNNIYIVISGNDDLYCFFKDIRKKYNFFKIIKLHQNDLLLNWNVVKAKKKLNNIFKKYFKDFRNSDIYFSSRFFAESSYYFLNRLKNYNKLIFFHPKNYLEYEPRDISIFNIKQKIKTIVIKLIYGNQISIYKFPGRIIPYIKDKFIDNVDEEIDIEKRRELVNARLLYKYFDVWDLGGFKVVFFDTPFQRDGIKKSKVLLSFSKDFFLMLSKYFNKNEIGVKFHPGEESIFCDSEELYTIIPSYIMGEFILDSNPNLIIISFWTTLLNSQLPFKSVSILKLANFLPQDLKDIKAKYILDRSERKIYFPSNFSELENIIKHNE